MPGDDACKHHPRRVLSRGAGSREGWRATRGIAGNAFGHRAGVSARRIHAAAHQPSGARLAATLAHELAATGGRLGLATLCVGVGQGVATLT